MDFGFGGLAADVSIVVVCASYGVVGSTAVGYREFVSHE